jgi:DNA replication protein DnaC
VLRCELLNLDDLGSELPHLAASALYDIVNTRLTTGSSKIINTNLDLKEPSSGIRPGWLPAGGASKRCHPRQ